MKSTERREQLLARRAARTVKTSDIDIGLAVLCAMRPPDPMTQQDIAEICNCTDERIRQIEKTALMKLRRQCRSLQPHLEEFA